ncbi:MAG: hypothetical protein FWH51_01040 [Dehalococcoidia bacterium]|nr:hypothetical protein [Dehalococcoidia bacterium]
MAGNNDIQENTAGLLCYCPASIGLIASIVFLIIDKRKFVRFCAIQSLLLYVVMIVLSVFLWLMLFVGIIITLAMLALWIILMVKAYQHEMFKLPVLGNLADQWSN